MKKKVTITIDEESLVQVFEIAQAQCRSISNMINIIVDDWIQQRTTRQEDTDGNH